MQLMSPKLKTTKFEPHGIRLKIFEYFLVKWPWLYVFGEVLQLGHFPSHRKSWICQWTMPNVLRSPICSFSHTNFSRKVAFLEVGASHGKPGFATGFNEAGQIFKCCSFFAIDSHVIVNPITINRETYHGCVRADLHVYRVDVSLSIKWLMKSLATKIDMNKVAWRVFNGKDPKIYSG